MEVGGEEKNRRVGTDEEHGGQFGWKEEHGFVEKGQKKKKLKKLPGKGGWSARSVGADPRD